MLHKFSKVFCRHSFGHGKVNFSATLTRLTVGIANIAVVKMAISWIAIGEESMLLFENSKGFLRRRSKHTSKQAFSLLLTYRSSSLANIRRV